MQTGERLGIFLAAGLSADHPRFGMLDMLHLHGALAGAYRPPWRGDAFFGPLGDLRPGLAGQLLAGISGDDAFGEWPGGHDPVDYPGRTAGLAYAVAASHRHPNCRHRMHTVEAALFDFSADFVQKLAGP